MSIAQSQNTVFKKKSAEFKKSVIKYVIEFYD